MARLFKLAYQLRMHRLGDAQQDILGRNLAFLAAAIILIQWLLRGRPPLSLWHWLVLGLILFTALGLIVLRRWSAHAGYVRFTSEPALNPPAPAAMEPEDKELLFATGRFEVEAREANLADLMAYWRTFASREHAVMAIQHESRFLLGSFPSNWIGMWYIFFRPENIEGLGSGTVAFGSVNRPGLQITYRRLPPSDGKKPKKPVRETVYLAFETEAARDRVWADLLAG